VAGRAGARRGLTLKPDRAIPRAFRVLMRRADAALAAAVAQPDERVRAVGGAVRDAFLGRSGGDLDLVAPKGRAEAFAKELSARAGSRVVPLGAPPKRILKVPFRSHEIDVWEETGDRGTDLLRRDFTVNTLSFSLPAGTFASAPGALADLKAKRLVPPRRGVFLEDPLRVLRAARFLAELPGFHIARAAFPELRDAAKILRKVAAERSLVEWDKLLGAPTAGREKGLRFLARIGALQSLLLSTAPRTRRGISLVSRLSSPDPRVARALLLLPLGKERAEEILREWKTSREEQRLAGRLFALGRRRPGRRAMRPPMRREIAESLRRLSPFLRESLLFLSSAGDEGTRRLVSALSPYLRRPAALRRILKPVRPLLFAEISSLLGLPESPELGAALEAFDLALAAGEVRGARGARAWLRRFRTPRSARARC
jgi:tRNA nucleotidyltransferase/poly(A) polymerase